VSFRLLHERPGRPLIVGNAWDVGSALLLRSLGFAALATTSSGFGATLGRRDYAVSREEALAYAKAVAEAVDIPVTGDLEDGFGAEPEQVAETVAAAARAGLAGGSIEDYTGDPAQPIHDLGRASERIAAAADAAAGSGADFVLTARAENHLHSRHDLEDTIRRLRAYEAAGADVLYAFGRMDLYRLVKQGLTEEEGYWIVDGGDPDELRQLREIIARRLAELDLPAGQLMGLWTEGETNVSPWKIVRQTSPASGAVVDVLDAGSFPTLCLSEAAWEQDYSIGPDGERLSVAVNASHGYELRPLEPEDPELLRD
jgi:hypothetical protein